MNNDIGKFIDLFKRNNQFQEKLKTAIIDFKGNLKEEAVYTDIFLPLASEYGLSISSEDFRVYIERMSCEDEEMTDDELSLVSGGSVKGWVINRCTSIGVGIGDVGGSVCVAVGF